MQRPPPSKQAFASCLLIVALLTQVAHAVIPARPSDFDGNGQTDIVVFRPSDGSWIRHYPLLSLTFGGAGDVPVPRDYNGDGYTDAAVYRPSNGTWYVAFGETVQWGVPGDIPVPADYNGDARTDFMVFRPSDGGWWLRLSGSGATSVTAWGGGDDIPVPGDYNGDGIADIAVYRPSTGIWYVRGFGERFTGVAADAVPVPGDYTGDGLTDTAIFSASSATWCLHPASGAPTCQQFGTDGDAPLAGDFNGNGSLDVAVFRPSDGTWHASGIGSVQWAVPGDIPVSMNAWRVDGPVLSPASGTYTSVQSVTASSATAGVTFRYTTDGTTPTLASPVLPVPYSVSSSLTLRVRAFKPGWLPSAAATSTYTINLAPTPMPTASPAGGIVPPTQTIALSGAAGTAIYYTLNGPPPDQWSTPYSGPIALPQGATSVTLRAIAYHPSWAPSAVRTETYTVQLPPAPMPTASPSGGFVQPSQTITLSGIAGATIHYSLDGTEPSEMYSTPVALPPGAPSVTLKAKAFHPDWSPSATLTASYTVNQTPAQTPTAMPTGGLIPASQTIALSGMAGATLHYTLDNSDPTPSSAEYSVPIALPNGAVTLKVKAFHPDWMPSATLTEVYSVDGTAPTILANVVPNAVSGWHRSPVTVSFTCGDSGSGTATCPGPVVVASDGAGQQVSGTTYDAAGNAATIDVTINYDSTAPAVVLTSTVPASSPTTGTEIEVQASAADSLSGVSAAHCNGAPATVASGAITCTVPLRKGRNVVLVDAVDGAGNNHSASLDMVRVGTPTALAIRPDQVTLLVGDERPVQVLDDFGQPVPSGVTWVSGDPLVAEVESGPEGEMVVAHALGQTTVTASSGGLTHAIHVEVVAGTMLTAGTVAWRTATAPGSWHSFVSEGAPDASGLTILAIEDDAAGHSLLKAIGPDGALKWDVNIPSAGYESWLAIGMPDGGAVVATHSAIMRVPGPGGGPAWRFAGSAAHVGRTPAGDVIAVLRTGSPIDREIVSIDGTTGVARWRHSLPRTLGHTTLNIDCDLDYDSLAEEGPATLSAPAIDEHGATYLFVRTSYSLFDYASGGVCEMYHTEVSGALRLLKVTEGGAATYTTLNTYAASATGPPGSVDLAYTEAHGGSLMPVAGGGVLVTTEETTHGPGGNTTHARLAAHDAPFSYAVDFPDPALGLVAVGESNRAIVSSEAAGSLVVNATTGNVLSTVPGTVLQVLEGNDLLVTGGNQVTHQTETGTVVATGPATLAEARHVGGALWVRDGVTGLEGLFGMYVRAANSLFPQPLNIAIAARYALFPVVQNFSGATIVIKKEGCEAGFTMLGGAPGSGASAKYYGWADGVIPPSVTGWNAGDWFKIPDLSRVNVESGGVQPTAYGPSTIDLGVDRFCRQDDPAQPGYEDCWGRRVEPQWSGRIEDGGLGHVDWRYPPLPAAERGCVAPPRWKIWEAR